MNKNSVLTVRYAKKGMLEKPLDTNFNLKGKVLPSRLPFQIIKI